eukprot:TRINITY_DN7884_c0_g1_i1.p1 TRINITY_DN7884_c0_g1~~TRINITY_DN7884_c0_g1_i1.p1  ORF type:complete len:191 (+),score=25.63 TRINITY_DN7884_c0_g1_i1:30-602(+)
MSFKIAVFGRDGVGKTSLVYRYITNNFTPDRDPTIEDSYRKLQTINHKYYELDILDTVGNGRELMDQYLEQATGFIYVYSPLIASTLREDLRHFHERLVRVKKSVVIPLVIVGTKLDLVTADPSLRELSREEGWGRAQELSCDHFECSAVDGTNVLDIFTSLLLRMEEYHPSQFTTNPVKSTRHSPCDIV